MQSNYSYSKEISGQPAYPPKIETSKDQLVTSKNRRLANDIQKLASDFFSGCSPKKVNHLTENYRFEVLPSQNDHRIATIETIAITHEILSSTHSAKPLNKSDWKELMQDLFSSEALVLEIHAKDAKRIKYHQVHTLKGQRILAKNGLMLHKKHGIIATSEEAKTTLMKQKIELHDDPHATPEMRKLIASLKEKPLNVSFFNAEMMQEFKGVLMQQMMTLQVIHSEPHVQITSEDIRKINQTYSNLTAQKGKNREKADPFLKAKEILIQIFMTSYQLKIMLEKERHLKIQEEEKENKRELQKKERLHEIEKKEDKDKEINLEMLAKNRSQHVQLDKNAGDVDSEMQSRRYRP